MLEHPDAQILQAVDEGVGAGLPRILGDDHAAHIQPPFPESVDEPEGVHVIGDAKVAPDLVLFNGRGRNHDHDFRLFPELHQHVDLAVRLESGQNTGGMVVVKELPAELQIQFSAEMGDPFQYLFRLQCVILVVVKSLLKHAYLVILT